MLLVQKRADRPGILEVPWTWLPFFLGADTDLVRQVDRALNERFKNVELTGDTEKAMHAVVLDLITSRYRLRGLREYLLSIENIDRNGVIEHEDGTVEATPAK